jgi:HAD superfamily hydrolase (TIGR01509 family)
MISAIVFDFSRVILDVKDKEYKGSLNGRHDELKSQKEYNLFDHFDLNNELLDLARQLKLKYPLYIFTTGHIHNESEIKKLIDDIFENTFSLEDIGGKKDDPASFLKVAKMINLSPKEILFIDDSQINIDTAKSAGFNVIKFDNNSQLFRDIQIILS